MTSHQLHTLADRLARQERITHSEACARLARRPRSSTTKHSSKHKLARQNDDFAAIEKPAAVYWWQKQD